MIIDTQTHYVPPASLELLTSIEDKSGGIVPGLVRPLRPDHPMFGLDERIREMDRTGVDVSVLSCAPLGTIRDGSAAARFAQVTNDGLIEACARFPDRLVMMATLPLPNVVDAVRELERLRGASALRGISIVAQTTLYRPDQIGLEAALAIAADLGLAVVIHPTAGANDLSTAFDEFGLGSALHTVVSGTLVAARLMMSGTLDRLPGLDLVVTHLGGVLPFLVERFELQGKSIASRPIGEYLRERLYYDFSGHSWGPALEFGLRTVGAERVMIGSDWPSRPIGSAIETIRLSTLSDAQKSAMLGGTAARWFDPKGSLPISPR